MVLGQEPSHGDFLTLCFHWYLCRSGYKMCWVWNMLWKEHKKILSLDPCELLSFFLLNKSNKIIGGKSQEKLCTKYLIKKLIGKISYKKIYFFIYFKRANGNWVAIWALLEPLLLASPCPSSRQAHGHGHKRKWIARNKQTFLHPFDRMGATPRARPWTKMGLV